jgi:ribosomal protein S18 acetylase RimI-like enzyme
MDSADIEWMILGHLNLAEFGRELARWSGSAGEIEERDGVLCFASGSTLPVMVNGAMRLDPSVPPDRLFATADAFFRARKRGYTVFVPQIEPDLVAACEDAGLPPMGGHSPEMVCDAVPDAVPFPAGFELRWARDEAGMRDYAEVSAQAYATYGMPVEVFKDVFLHADRFSAPHVHSAIAYDGDMPVSAAQVICSHGIAGVYTVGTVPEARGKGLADACTRAVTRRAFERGARVVTLQASEMGHPIYLRMGYRDLFTYTYYVKVSTK